MDRRWVRAAGLVVAAGIAIGAAPPASGPVPPPLTLKCSYTGEITRSATGKPAVLVERFEGMRYYRLAFRKPYGTSPTGLSYEIETESVWIAEPGRWETERCSNQTCEVRATLITYKYQYLGAYPFDKNAAPRPSLQTGEFTIDRATGAYRFEQTEYAAKPFEEARFGGPLREDERAPDGTVVTERRTGTCEKSAGPETAVKF